MEFKNERKKLSCQSLSSNLGSKGPLFRHYPIDEPWESRVKARNLTSFSVKVLGIISFSIPYWRHLIRMDPNTYVKSADPYKTLNPSFG